jgi:transposase
LLTRKEEELKSAEAIIKDIRRRTKRSFSSKEKLRIVISRMRGDESISRFAGKKALLQRFVTDKLKTLVGLQAAVSGGALKKANAEEVFQSKNENLDVKIWWQN